MAAETVGRATRDSGTRWHASLQAPPHPHPTRREMPSTTSMCGNTHVFFNEFFSYSNFFHPHTHTLRQFPRSRMRQLAGNKALLAFSQAVATRRVNTSFAFEWQNCQLPLASFQLPDGGQKVGRVVVAESGKHAVSYCATGGQFPA